MNSFIPYFIEANFCLLIFGLFYLLVLQKGTHFRFSRYYLSGAALLTLIVPLLHFENPFAPTAASGGVATPLQYMMLPEMIFGGVDQAVTVTTTGDVPWTWWGTFAYLLIMMVFLTLFIHQVYQVFRLRSMKKGRITTHNGYEVIPTDGHWSTFSFFNMVFFDNTAVLTDEEKQKIIEHEVAHIDQKHTLDIVILELLKVVFWINPFAWWMKRHAQDVHEYLADQSMLRHTDEQQYSSLLARMALKQMSLPIGHHFNRSLTLKRIKMMKTAKTRVQTWKWLSMAPMLLIILTLSCNDEITRDIDEVMATASQTTLPAELQADMNELEKKYPNAEFVYMETDGTSEEALNNLQGVDPNSIAHIKVWKEREKIGVIVNKSGAIKDFAAVDADSDEVFVMVEEPAVPVNGFQDMYGKLAEALIYPGEARDAGVEGKVYVQFVVDKDGTLTEIQVVKGPDHGLHAAAVAAMKTIEPFKPAKQRGKAVKQRLVLPITFKLDDVNEEEAKKSESLGSTWLPKVIGDEMNVYSKRSGMMVTGVVRTPDGRKPVAGVNIVIQGSTRGTVTDREGRFSITAEKESDVLVFSHVSYETKNIFLDNC